MISIEIVKELLDSTAAGALIKKSFNYKPAGPMPVLSNKNLEHTVEIEKIKYLIKLIETPKFYILAKDGLKLVGFGIISESNLQYFYDLTWVCVDPDYRNQGLGKHLTTKALEFAKNADRDIIVTTEIPKFYTEVGFHIANNYRNGWYLMTSSTFKEEK